MLLPFNLIVPRARPSASKTCIGAFVATAAGERKSAVVASLELDPSTSLRMTLEEDPTELEEDLGAVDEELVAATLELDCAALDIPYSYAPRSGAPPTYGMPTFTPLSIIWLPFFNFKKSKSGRLPSA